MPLTLLYYVCGWTHCEPPPSSPMEHQGHPPQTSSLWPMDKRMAIPHCGQLCHFLLMPLWGFRGAGVKSTPPLELLQQLVWRFKGLPMPQGGRFAGPFRAFLEKTRERHLTVTWWLTYTTGTSAANLCGKSGREEWREYKGVRQWGKVVGDLEPSCKKEKKEILFGVSQSDPCLPQPDWCFHIFPQTAM